VTRGRQRKAPAVGWCGGGRRRFVGVMHKCVPGLGFKRGLHWEVAGGMGNLSRCFGGGGSGWSGGAVARGGSGTSVTNSEHGKARERERSGGRVSSPQCEAPGALAQRRGAAVRQAAEARQWRAADELGARVSRAGGGCGLGEKLGHGRALK
jgi:hypothetical protein